MKRIAIAAVAALALVSASTATAASTPTPAQASAKPPPTCTAPVFRPFSAKVWNLDRWRRGQPKAKTIEAQRRRVKCAGPGHRRAMQHRWRADKRAYYAERGRCRSGDVIEGRVSWFNGPSSSTASGLPVSLPGLALNIAPGTDSGWNNSTTRGWMAAAAAGNPQIGVTTISGRTTRLPIIDLGPSGFTRRAIDVTEAGVLKLGLSPSSFPTDSIGRVKLLPDGC